MAHRALPRPRRFALACLLAITACETEHATPAAVEAPTPARTAPRSNPLVDLTADPSEYDATVVASLAAGEYAYVELEPAPANGERRWAVTLGELPPVGAVVHAKVAGTKHDFESRRLQRTFERLDFATLEIL